MRLYRTSSHAIVDLVRTADPRDRLWAGVIVGTGIALALLLYLLGVLDVFGYRPGLSAAKETVYGYEGLVSSQPKNAEAWRGYVSALRAAGLYDEAEKALAQGLKATADAPALKVQQAYLLAQQGKDVEAISVASAAAKSEDARLRKPAAEMAKQRTQMSTADFDQSTLIEAYVLVGSLEGKARRWDRAVQAYSAALKSNGTLVDVLTARGAAYLEMKSFALASADFRNALRFDPQNASALAGLKSSETSMGVAE